MRLTNQSSEDMPEANVVPLSQPARPLDRRLTVTVFRDQAAKTKQDKVIAFRDLAEAIPKLGAPHKESLPWLKLATFGDEASDKGCLRTNTNMRWIDGVEADHDASTMQPAEAARLLREAGIAAIVVTTASHTPEKPRFRVLCPTSRSLPVVARQKLAARVNGVLKGAVSNKDSFTDSQSFYFGQVANAQPLQVLVIDSRRTIDQAGDLDAGAIGKDGKPYSLATAADDLADDLSPAELPDWVASAVEAIPGSLGKEYFDWLDIGMGLHHGSNGGDDGLELFHGFSERTGLYDAAEINEKWNSYGKQRNAKQITLGTIWHLAKQHGWTPPARAKEYDIDLQKLDFDQWEKRDLPPPDCLLGEIISTTTRALVIAPTGIGKTKLVLAASTAIAGDRGFLDWRTCGRPRRVLYIDGEMSARVFKRRLRDAARETGKPTSLHAFNREDFPDMQPLNTEEGQAFIDQLIEKIEEAYDKLDLIVFDNIQALIPGDLKDPEAWQNVLPWARKLTSQAIGQLWVHHTGKNEALGGYGDSTREWQLDVVAQLKRIKDSPFDVAFTLTFTKARERSPDNREDFRPINVYLDNAEWRCETAAATATVKLTPSQQAAFDLIPHRGMNFADWRDACLESDMVTDAEKRDAKRAQFKKAKDALVSKGLIVIRDHKVGRSQATDEIFDDISEL